MPKRKRPKSFNYDRSIHTKLRKRWKSWLPDIRRDLTDLLGKREIFWDLQEVAKKNKAVLSPGDFFDWMCRNYVIAISVGIRSFLDQRDSRSLWRMLYEMLEHPGVLNRTAHVQMYVSIPGAEYGHLTFDNIVGSGQSSLSPKAIRGDLRKIEDASERVRRFVNKRIAHRAPPGALRRLPKFNELDAALDTLDSVFCKYDLLLAAHSSASMHATRQHNWQQVLWEPWISRGSKLHPDSQ